MTEKDFFSHHTDKLSYNRKKSAANDKVLRRIKRKMANKLMKLIKQKVYQKALFSKLEKLGAVLRASWINTQDKKFISENGRDRRKVITEHKLCQCSKLFQQMKFLSSHFNCFMVFCIY